MGPPVALGKGPGESCRIIQQKPFILQFSLFFNLKNGWEIFKIGLCFLRKPISLSDQVGVVFWVYLLLALHSGTFPNFSPQNSNSRPKLKSTNSHFWIHSSDVFVKSFDSDQNFVYFLSRIFHWEVQNHTTRQWPIKCKERKYIFERRREKAKKLSSFANV